jgi:hypothetical protein
MDGTKETGLTSQQALQLADTSDVRFAVVPATDAFNYVDPAGGDIRAFHREQNPHPNPVDLVSHGPVHLFGSGTYFSLDPNETQYGNVVTEMVTPRSALQGSTAVVWLDENGSDQKYMNNRPSVADAPGTDMVVVGLGLHGATPIRNFVFPLQAQPVLQASTVTNQMTPAQLQEAAAAYPADLQALKKEMATGS